MKHYLSKLSYSERIELDPVKVSAIVNCSISEIIDYFKAGTFTWNLGADCPETGDYLGIIDYIEENPSVLFIECKACGVKHIIADEDLKTTYNYMPPTDAESDV